MTKIKFFFKNNLIVGFTSDGHANTAEFGSDVLCAGISSALYLVTNTITEIYKFNPDISVSDGHFSIMMSDSNAGECQNILQGLLLHFKSLEKDYPKNMKISTKILNT